MEFRNNLKPYGKKEARKGHSEALKTRGSESGKEASDTLDGIRGFGGKAFIDGASERFFQELYPVLYRNGLCLA